MASFRQESMPRHSTEYQSVMESCFEASEAAELLLQVRQIACKEIINESRTKNVEMPLQLTRIPTPSQPVLSTNSSMLQHGINQKTHTANSTRRFRAVSIGSPCDLFDSETLSPLVTPVQVHKKILGLSKLASADFIISSTERHQYDISPGYLVTPRKTLIREEYIEDSPGDNREIPMSVLSSTKKFVGETLPKDVTPVDVLRKKFSWKSFPQLEAYLVEHREQYLQYSNSLNYTKAQKIYNNKLTQGLLEVAAQHGYIFEGFTFAAVRDRIRCFYKSFVQATKKKKKRNPSRGRSVTM